MSVDSDQIINIQFSTGIHIWKKFKSVIVEGRLPWHLALSYHLSIWKEDKVLSERDLLHSWTTTHSQVWSDMLLQESRRYGQLIPEKISSFFLWEKKRTYTFIIHKSQENCYEASKFSYSHIKM